jgi:cytochrome d ubiquinol oxidase subunit II
VTDAVVANSLAFVMLAAMNAYLLLGGADYGGGVWDLLASGPRKERQRALIADSIGPVWEANHVWLILAVVILFTCFPPAFAMISVELHVPLTLMLVGVVLRGSAFTFRTYDSHHDTVQRRWGLLFSLSSVLTPALLGICAGAIASGAVGAAATAEAPVFSERFIDPWLNPFAFGVGALMLALCAFLAAVYLAVEAGDDRELADDFRRRALWAAGAVFVAAFGTLLAAAPHAPRVMSTMGDLDASLLLHLATGACAIVAIAAIWRRAYRVARWFAAAQTSFILWGWALSDYPYLIPIELTIAGASAPAATQRLVLGALVLGAVILFPSLIYLFRVFKRQPAIFGELHEETTEYAVVTSNHPHE